MKRNMEGFLAGILFLFFASGCVARVDQVPYSPAEASHINTIGIPTVSPSKLTFQKWGGHLAGFGLIGALILTTETNAKEKALFSGDIGRFYAHKMQIALVESLKREGYDTVTIPVERKKEGKFLDMDSNSFEPEVDAILDVVIVTNGYTDISWPKNAKTQIGGFRPMLRVATKLVSADKKTLYSNTFMYGQLNKYVTATDIEAAPESFFEDFNSMKENPKKVNEGLELAITRIAKEISGHLSKRKEGQTLIINK